MRYIWVSLNIFITLDDEVLSQCTKTTQNKSSLDVVRQGCIGEFTIAQNIFI